MGDRDRPGVMCFSPIVNNRNLASTAADLLTKSRNTPSLHAQMAARNASRVGNKENVEGVEKASTEGGGTLTHRVQKSVAHMNQTILLDMKKENDSARSFLREVSSGRAGNDGPYFSPCRAKGAEDEKYRANVSEDEEYEMLLSSQAKKTRQEPAKEAALQRTINLKLRQATQELLNKRNGLAEKMCRLDDGFAEKERSYKKQMETFSHQIRKEQALRVRAEEQAESFKKTAESQTANVQAVAKERDDVLMRLQIAQEELAGRSSMEEETRLQLISLADSVNVELAAAVAQLHHALEEGARAIGEHETVMQAKAQELQAKYDEDVGLLRMQIEEMSEAREEELQRFEVQIREMQSESLAKAEEAQAQAAELRAHIDDREARVEEKGAEIADLHSKLQDAVRQLQEKDTLLDVKSAELAALRDEAEGEKMSLSSELEQKADEISAHLRRIDELQSATQSLQEQLQQKRQEHAAMQEESDKKLAAKEREVNTVSSTLSDCEAHLSETETRVGNLTETVHGLNAEIAALQQALSEEVAKGGEALALKSQELDEISASLEERGAQLHEAEAALNAKENLVQEILQQQLDLQAQHKQLQDEHVGLVASDELLQQNLSQVQRDLEEANLACERTETALSEEKMLHEQAVLREKDLQQVVLSKDLELRDLQGRLDAEGAAHSEEAAEHHAQIDGLKAQIATLQEEGGCASATAERHAATIADLQEQLQKTKEECKRLGTDIQLRQEREDRLRHDVEREENKNETLQNKLETLEAKAGDLRTSLAVAQSQLTSMEEDSKRRQEREDRREAELGECKAQVQELIRVRDGMVEERDRREAEVAEGAMLAAQDRDDLACKLSASQAAVVELQDELSAKDEDLKAQVQALAHSTASLQEKVSEVLGLEEKLHESLHLHQQAERDAALALEEKRLDCDTQVASNKALELEKKELMWKIETQEDKMADLKAQLAAVQQQLEERRKDLDQREQDKEEARMEAARLRAEKDMQTSKLEETRAMLEDKESQIKEAIKTVQQVQNMSQERSKEFAKEREGLLQDLERSKDDLVLANRELDANKKLVSELEAKQREAEEELSKNAIELESVRADATDLSLKLEKVGKEKSAASERLAVLEAEYRTYKAVCNTPTKLADQLNKLVSLEADRASVQSRLFEAEEDAESSRSLVSSLKEQVKELKQKLNKAENTRRRLHNELQELKGNIRVFARVRPANERCVLGIDDENGAVMVPHNGSQNSFKFDRAFNARASQDDVFAEVSQFVQSALDGFNVSLFAYGQTGSGKTHTMFGSNGDVGIIPRSILQILEAVEEQKENNWEYALEASFLEIYQEQIFDLLCNESEREGKKHTIVQGENGRHDVTDLQWRSVRTQGDVEAMLEASQANKHVARTDMNERSSRSHTVFSLRISGARAAAGGQVQTLHGTLHLVDLAGSERLAKSNATGDRLKETQAINKSLSALSDVFVAISKHNPHVPYRNSKLTFLLQPCLSGDGKALMIANCSPVETSAHETLCTLRFASMVSNCELGKATKHIVSEKNPNNSLASHLSVRCDDSVLSLTDIAGEVDMSLDSSISSICTNTSAITSTTNATSADDDRKPAMRVGPATRRAQTARSEPSEPARPTTRRAAAAASSTSRPPSAASSSSASSRLTRGAAAGDAKKKTAATVSAPAQGKVFGLITPGGTLKAPSGAQ